MTDTPSQPRGGTSGSRGEPDDTEPTEQAPVEADREAAGGDTRT